MDMTVTDVDEESIPDDVVPYKILKSEAIFDNITKLVQQVKEVINLPESSLLVLLNYVKWNPDRLFDSYYENEEKLFKNVNIHCITNNQIALAEISSIPIIDTIVSCEICCNSVRQEHTSNLLCGHRYCNDCWEIYLRLLIMDEKVSLNITCPESNCSILVEYDFIKIHIKDEEVMKNYKQLIAKKFVQTNKWLRWCPRVGCDKIIEIETIKWMKVTCSCGTNFCFLCGKDWHYPVSCTVLLRWLKKCNDDSETVTWMKAYTKNCPQCNTVIEKNGGCNHMTCRSQFCKYEFCWICLRAWNQQHIWESCNRFTQPGKEALNALHSLQRYIHFYDRYMNHMKSLQFESKVKDAIHIKMNLFQINLKMPWIEVQFFQKAADILCKCRNTVMYSYTFTYYLIPTNQSKIFEDNQRDLEIATENMSRYLEMDYRTLTTNGSKDPYEIKHKIMDMSAYCESRRCILIKHVDEGYKKNWWTYY